MTVKLLRLLLRKHINLAIIPLQAALVELVVIQDFHLEEEEIVSSKILLKIRDMVLVVADHHDSINKVVKMVTNLEGLPIDLDNTNQGILQIQLVLQLILKL